MPTHPPALVTLAMFSNAPMVNSTKVAVKKTKTASTATETRNEAMVMYAVKIVHPRRKTPTAIETSLAGWMPGMITREST